MSFCKKYLYPMMTTAVLGAAWVSLGMGWLQKAANPEPVIIDRPMPATSDDIVVMPARNLERQAELKVAPSFSRLELDMLVIAVHQEAGNQGTLGMMAVTAAILNRVGHTCLTVAICLQAPGQYSFVNQTSIGKIIAGKSQADIADEADKKQYSSARRAVAGVLVDGYYRDYALGARYYYNPEKSSVRGKAWFAKATVPIYRINQHVFCMLKKEVAA